MYKFELNMLLFAHTNRKRIQKSARNLFKPFSLVLVKLN